MTAVAAVERRHCGGFRVVNLSDLAPVLPSAVNISRGSAAHAVREQAGDTGSPVAARHLANASVTDKCVQDFAVALGISCVSRICQYLGIRHMLNHGWALIRTRLLLLLAVIACRGFANT